MQIQIDEQWLPVYEALASKVRLEMIRLLAERPMNVKELAQALGLSSAIMTMHVKKLEKAGIIRNELVPSKGGVQKISRLSVDFIGISFPGKVAGERECHRAEVSVGHYTDFDIAPTCGLATPKQIIGHFDDPRCFLDPDRVDAKILWFGQGYVEYKVPNYLLGNEIPEELEISLEVSSEAPNVNHEWPSDITFILNGVSLGYWTSPGDFGGTKGRYTPSWWNLNINQYGLLKIIRVNRSGTFMDGEKMSDVTLEDLDIRRKYWTFRIAVPEDAANVGGATLFGTGFGNYAQDIVFKLYYAKAAAPAD